MKFAADNLSILLSTDWFISVWSLCGLQSSGAVRSHVQKECRLIVESIVEGGGTYWEAEFSESRGHRTKAELTRVLMHAGMTHDDQVICNRYLNGVDDAPDPEANLALVETLCSLFVSEHKRGEGVPGQFDQRAIGCIEVALDEMSSERLLAEASAHAVVTKWDSWLRQLTPDLPTFTTDTARELARHAGSHAKLLAALRVNLSPDELSRLGAWLSKSAIDLAGVTLPLAILTSS